MSGYTANIIISSVDIRPLTNTWTGTTNTFNGNLVISGANAAIGTGSGALQVSAGGLGVNGAAYVGGLVVAQNTADATATGTGSLQVSGGVGVKANLVVGGNVNIGPAGNIIIQNTAEATATGTGSLQVSGGVGVKANVFVGGNAYVLKNVGIGTTTASLPLTIQYGAAGAAVSHIQLYGGGLANSTCGINLDTYNSRSSPATMIRAIDNGAYGASLTFWTAPNGTTSNPATTAAERLRIDGSGNVGIGTSPISLLTVNPTVYDSNSFNFSTCPLTVTNPTPTSTTVLNDSLPVLHLCRQGTSGQAYGARASFHLSRYSSAGGNTSSCSRLDLVMANASFDSVNVLTALGSGNIGIGTTSPGQPLDVIGGIRATSTTGGNTITVNGTTDANNLYTATTGGRSYYVGSGGTGSGGGAGNFYIYDGTAVAARFVVNSSGNVGINTTNPGCTLDVYKVANVAVNSITGIYFNNSGTSLQTTAGFGAIVIRANGDIVCSTGAIGAYSDIRTKNILLNKIEDDYDLINKIDVVQYRYKDVLKGLNRKHYGFIAQDIQKVLPDQITYDEGFIADIMKEADNVEGKIITIKGNELVEGDEIKIIDYEGKEHEVKVTRKIDKERIEIEKEIEGRLFIYGKKVKDIYVLEHQSLFALAFSGVKRLIEDNKKQDKIIDEQKNIINTLQSQIQNILNRLDNANI